MPEAGLSPPQRKTAPTLDPISEYKSRATRQYEKCGLDPKRVEKTEYVLAVDRGLIIDVFVAEKWLEATAENFPGITPDWKGRRWGFVGHEAPEEVASLYKRCRVPDIMRRRGAANPIRYANKSGSLDDPDGDTPERGSGNRAEASING